MNRIKPASMVVRVTSIIVLLVTAWTTHLFAEADHLTPTQVVQTAISDVLADMRTHETEYQQEPALLNTLVEQKVLPYFNFSRMTQLAMAKNWNTASEAQRTAVTEAFQALFVAVYSKQFFTYRNTDAEIEPQPGATDNKATLKLKAVNPRGEKVALFLRLEKKTDTWQVIDVNVDGISYVVTNRGQFSEAIANNGIDGLIQYLQEAKQQQTP